jgi:hypothetical protein
MIRHIKDLPDGTEKINITEDCDCTNCGCDDVTVIIDKYGNILDYYCNICMESGLGIIVNPMQIKEYKINRR